MEWLTQPSQEEFPWLEEDQSFVFPPPQEAHPEGVVCFGGNLSPGMLLSAYRQGIFPWYSEGQPILWWSPEPRFVLFPEELHISRSMKKLYKKRAYRISVDEDFSDVIEGCSRIERPGQEGTWITDEMKEAYKEMHRLGYAHSVEVWQDKTLAGGLYGISLGSLFFGESMFSKRPNASKYGFLAFAAALRSAGFSLIDSQVYTPHLSSLGARDIPRAEYLEHLYDGLSAPTLKGSWRHRFTRLEENLLSSM